MDDRWSVPLFSLSSTHINLMMARKSSATYFGSTKIKGTTIGELINYNKFNKSVVYTVRYEFVKRLE